MSSRRSTSAPPRVARRSASRAVRAAGPLRPRATRSAFFTSTKMSPRSFDALPSTPSPTRPPPAPLPEPAVQYVEYAVWQREQLQGGVFEQQLDYWKRRLEGVPAALEL